MDVNKTIIKGIITSKYRTKNDHIVLGIKTCKHNFPSIFFPKSVSADKADQFDVGDNVEIIGSLQSSKKNDVFSCSIFGQDISLSDNDDRRNFFELHGRIIKFQTLPGELYRLTIETEADGHYSTVPVVFYNKKYEKTLLEHQLGQCISIYGVVQTKKIYIDDQRIYYTNYVGFSCA